MEYIKTTNKVATDRYFDIDTVKNTPNSKYPKYTLIKRNEDITSIDALMYENAQNRPKLKQIRNDTNENGTIEIK